LAKLIFAINYKAYETAFNERSLDIARAASRLSSRYQGDNLSGACSRRG